LAQQETVAEDRFREEGIEGLRKKSTRPNQTNRIPEDVERRIVEVRKATGFGSERIAIIVNKGLEIEGRKSAILHATTCLPGMLKLKGGCRMNIARLNGMILMN